jgi:hypothetical protein
MPDRLDCVRTDELIPELAIGVASGDERAPALGHLAGCVRCRGDLESATAAADALLLLAPEREPPPGFESRVLNGVSEMGAAAGAGAWRAQRPPPRRPSPHRSRLRTAVLGVAAAVAIAGVAGGTVWWRTSADRDLAHGYRQTLAVAHGRYLRAVGLLTQGTTSAGHMFAYEGKPSWLLVIVRTSDVSGAYAVGVTTHDGRRIPLGTMNVAHGQGSWSVTLAMPIDQIATVALTNPGTPPLTARL